MKTPKFYKKDGTEDTARSKRYARIVSGIGHLAGTSVKCPALGGVPVKITLNGIRETAFHASKSPISTAAALDLKKQISTAKNPIFKIPKKGTQTKKFGFKALFILKGVFNAHTTKITVGMRRCGSVLEYCLTAEQ